LQGVFKAFGKWLEYRFRAYFKLGRCKLSLDDDLDNFIKKIDLVDSFKETFNRKMCEGRLIRWDLLSDNDVEELNDIFKKIKK
jgi:hypothetical protein